MRARRGGGGLAAFAAWAQSAAWSWAAPACAPVPAPGAAAAAIDAGGCEPGAVERCYTGRAGTLGVGPCAAGRRACGVDGAWSACEGEVAPAAEDCGDGIDNNCNGLIDEVADLDGDGYWTCGAQAARALDCCDSTECADPARVNPGAFDVPGNGIDDDCSGAIDDAPRACDEGLPSRAPSGLDIARAIELCPLATDGGGTWGVVDASITLADGTGAPDPEAYAIRPRFGEGVLPRAGARLAMISTGGAAAKGDTAPGYHPWISYAHAGAATSAPPADWLAAHGGALPNAPGCPPPRSGAANDPVMIALRVRVPTNARSFQLSTAFFSAEFPEYTCNAFNDFFVVLLDSAYRGEPANPADKNLAFFQPAGSADRIPVGVNLAHGDTGLFTQCVNGPTGCAAGSVPGAISSCTGTAMLAGTGFDEAFGGSCGGGALLGGGTGWLVTRGNVVPGELITLRIAIWDTSDQAYDSIAILDGFAWSSEPVSAGTVIY